MSRSSVGAGAIAGAGDTARYFRRFDSGHLQERGQTRSANSTEYRVHDQRHGRTMHHQARTIKTKLF